MAPGAARGLDMGSEHGGGFLDDAYDLDGSAATKDFYGEWARTYEEEVRANGYVTPQRCAAALAANATDTGAPLLDLGCGTGLSGEAFRAAGFAVVDGTDFSAEMIAYARAKPDLYRSLVLGDLTRPIPAEPGEYANVAAVGVFSPGHAPAAMLDAVLALLDQDGCFVFSLNDHALADPSFEARIAANVDAGIAEVAFQEYGDHLPGRGLRASVYVLRRR